MDRKKSYLAPYPNNVISFLDYKKSTVKYSSSTAYCCHRNGRYLYELEKYEYAIHEYDKAVRYKPDDADIYFDRALCLGELKRYEEAISAYDASIKYKPNYINAYYNKGHTLVELRRYQEAIDAYNTTIKHKPDYASAYFNKGYALGSRLDKYEEAIDAYNMAIKYKPGYVSAHFNKGYVLGRLGRCEEAVDACTMAIKYADANHHNRDYELRKFFVSGLLGIDYCKEGPWYYISEITLLARSGRYEEDIDEYEQTIQCEPDNTSTYYKKGNSVGALGYDADAITEPSIATKHTTYCTTSRCSKGNSFKELHKYQDSIPDYNEGVRYNIKYLLTFFNKEYALNKLCRYQKAITSYYFAINFKQGSHYTTYFKKVYVFLKHLLSQMKNHQQKS